MSEHKICCPYCGAEYLPAEIFIPKAFFGEPKDIDKEAISGKIRDYFGTEMDLVEEYRCDKCNTKFAVEADVQFYTSIIDYGSKDDYSTKVKKVQLFMSEDD